MSQYESILGLDLSLTRTGMASIDITVGAIVTRALTSTRRGHERLQYLKESILLAAETHDIVGIEGLSMKSFDKDHEQAGFAWMVRQELWYHRIPYVLVPPSKRMFYATGAGGGARAAKKLVHEAAQRMWPEVPLKTDDEADAILIAAVTGRVVGAPFGPWREPPFYEPVNSMRVVEAR